MEVTLDQLKVGREFSGSELFAVIEACVDTHVQKCRLQYGSVVYFCFGEAVLHKVGNSMVPYGEMDIYVEGDHWTVLHEGRRAFDSESISRDKAETELDDLLSGQRLEKISSQDSFCCLEFSANTTLRVRSEPSVDQAFNAPICVTLPDGHIVDVFEDSRAVPTGSFEKDKAKHWRSKIAKRQGL